MKHLLFVLLLLFVFTSGFGQASSYATVRQIYDFSVGDTFQYSQYSQGSSTYLYTSVSTVADRINFGNDSIVYNFNIYDEGDTVAHPSVQVITDLDSVFSYPGLSIYCYSAPPFPCNITDTILLQNSDTIYQVRDYEPVLYARCTEDGAPDGYDTAQENDVVQYGKGLGIIGQDLFILDPSCGQMEKGEQLICVHKANGTIWHGPCDFFTVSINDVQLSDFNAQIFPNPASSEFTVQLNTLPVNDLIFKLVDITGREVEMELLKTESTMMHRGTLASGVYFYSLMSQEQVIRYGKLMLD